MRKCLVVVSIGFLAIGCAEEEDVEANTRELQKLTQALDQQDRKIRSLAKVMLARGESIKEITDAIDSHTKSLDKLADTISSHAEDIGRLREQVTFLQIAQKRSEEEEKQSTNMITDITGKWKIVLPKPPGTEGKCYTHFLGCGVEAGKEVLVEFKLDDEYIDLTQEGDTVRVDVTMSRILRTGDSIKVTLGDRRLTTVRYRREWVTKRSFNLFYEEGPGSSIPLTRIETQE